MATRLTETLPGNEHQVRGEHSLDNQRLLSLDVFRGFIVAGMILVTDPGTYAARYWPLCHAEWNGATPTDMIFPSFLVMVGIAMTLSFASRVARGASRKAILGHVARRTVLLFLLGLLVNGFPHYDLHTIRIPGILQRIAVCYFFGSLLYLALARLKAARRAILMGSVIAGLLFVYWVLLMFVPAPGFGAGRLDSLGNLPAYIDRAVIGTRHMWAYGTTPGYGVTYDPEGILSTLPALATLLFGVLAGEWIRTEHSRSRKCALLLLAGAALTAAGLALTPWLVLNKRILTPTFALFSSGIALLLFASFYFLLDVKHWRNALTRPLYVPFMVFGTNAIFAFALSSVVTSSLDVMHVTIGGSPMRLHEWGYRYGFSGWLSPITASLTYAIVIVVLDLAIMYPLYRRRIFLRL